MIKIKSAAPYLVWMVLFIAAPLAIVVYFAMTDKAGNFTLENLMSIGRYSSVFARSLILAAVATPDLPGAEASRWGTSFPACGSQAEDHAHAGDAAHVDELFAAHLCLDEPLGKQRHHQPLFGRVRHRAVPDDQHQRRGGAGHGVQLFALYDPAALHRDGEDRRQRGGGRAGSGGRHPENTHEGADPLSAPGISTGITMVFVPSVSTFIISRMLGGGGTLLAGDLIELQFLGNSYNYNLGSAMSLVLMVIVLLCMSFTSGFDDQDMEGCYNMKSHHSKALQRSICA